MMAKGTPTSERNKYQPWPPQLRDKKVAEALSGFTITFVFQSQGELNKILTILVTEYFSKKNPHVHMQCFKFIQNRSRLTALNLSKTAQHVTFRIFFTLCSTYSPRFELFRFLTARKSANKIIACCFNSVLPKKKNLLLWIRFNSWKFRP